MTVATVELASRTTMFCTCMRFEAFELIARWRARARPTLRRMQLHGHAIDPMQVGEVLTLMTLVERGVVEAFSKENWHRSHHLPECQFSNKRTPMATVDFSTELPWASPR